MRAIYMAFLALEGVGMIGAACGDLLTFTWFCLRLNAVLGIVNISLALLLAIRRTPTGRVMLIAIAIATFNMLIRVLDGMNTLPPAFAWLKSDIFPNPVIAVVEPRRTCWCWPHGFITSAASVPRRGSGSSTGSSPNRIACATKSHAARSRSTTRCSR